MPKQDVSIARHFAGLPDPRVDRTKKHALGDILVIALCAVVCGADSWEEVEAFGQAKADWLRRFLTLPNGIPSHDTFGRVFGRLDPNRFGECVAGWMAAVCEAAGLRHIAVDGKACRSAPRGTFSGCLHLVSAWAAEMVFRCRLADLEHPFYRMASALDARSALRFVRMLVGAILARGRQTVTSWIRAAGLSGE